MHEWQVMVWGVHLTVKLSADFGTIGMTGQPGIHGVTLQASPLSFMTVYLLHCSNPRMTVPLLADSTSSRQTTHNQYTSAQRNPYTSSAQQLRPPFDVSCDDERWMINDASDLHGNIDIWYDTRLLAGRYVYGIEHPTVNCHPPRTSTADGADSEGTTSEPCPSATSAGAGSTSYVAGDARGGCCER